MFPNLIDTFNLFSRRFISLLKGSNHTGETFKILVCMTTTPERLTSTFLYRVLDSILAQKTACPFKMVLFVPRHSLRGDSPYPDPSFLRERYSGEELAIHRCDDMGPATKFAGLLTYLPLADEDITHIYIADDDIILREDVFRKMLARLHARSLLQGYHRLVLANHAGSLRGLPTVAGYAGILVPVGFFREMLADTRLATVWSRLAEKNHPCFNVDDILLSKLLHRFKYTVKRTKLDPFTEVMDRALTDEHPEWFELCKHTARDQDNIQCLNVTLP